MDIHLITMSYDDVASRTKSDSDGRGAVRQSGRKERALATEFETGVEMGVGILDSLETRMNASRMVDGAGFEPATPAV
jgi:hypothetical protein